MAPVHRCTPERREDKVHLDEDGPEGQQAARERDDPRLHEPASMWRQKRNAQNSDGTPFLLRNDAWERVDAAWQLDGAGDVAAQHRPNNGQRHNHKCENAHNEHLSGEISSSRVICEI